VECCCLDWLAAWALLTPMLNLMVLLLTPMLNLMLLPLQ